MLSKEEYDGQVVDKLDILQTELHRISQAWEAGDYALAQVRLRSFDYHYDEFNELLDEARCAMEER